MLLVPAMFEESAFSALLPHFVSHRRDFAYTIGQAPTEGVTTLMLG